MNEFQRAYSGFEVKALDKKMRTFRGWATTPTMDRVNDTVNPKGVTFKNPLPLLHQHRHTSPIGTALFKKPTAQGIEFDAGIPYIEEPGSLKDRVDTAWGEIEHGLVRAVSIGFRPIKYAYKEDGGIDFQETEVYELSAVTIPANSEALITSLKSLHDRGIYLLPNELVQEIKSLDYHARRQNPVQLIKSVVPEITPGAVRLIRP